MQKLLPVIRSAAAHAPSEAVDGESRLLPCAPVKSSLEGAGSVEDNEATYCAKFIRFMQIMW